MNNRKKAILELELKANKMRKEILEMIVDARGTHIACALSIIDILVVLYDIFLTINPRDLSAFDRDRFVLSKGHGCAALYVVLANYGFFPKSVLKTYCTERSILGGHPDSTRVPGIETSTGSLGHGLSVAVGFALANKLDKNKFNVYCLVGDGECNEGAIWEAVMAGAHHKLDNLVLIIDNNGLQISGFTRDIMDPLSFDDKFQAFGWNTVEIDGHNFYELVDVFSKVPIKNSKPTAIIANTIKGKGVSYMENERKWHSMLPNEKEMAVALNELEGKINTLKKQLQ